MRIRSHYSVSRNDMPSRGIARCSGGLTAEVSRPTTLNRGFQRLKKDLRLPCGRCLCLLFFLFLFSLHLPVYAEMFELNLSFACGRLFFNYPDKEPFAAKAGQYHVPGLTSVITLADGQGFIKTNSSEIRLKQETILAIADRNKFELRRGLAGFMADSEPIKLNTAHFVLEFSDALVVVKTNPAMTRACVVKGSVTVTQGRQSVSLKAGQEIAAAPQRLSKIYQQSDELRFTWYWVEPEKEPALQNRQLIGIIAE